MAKLDHGKSKQIILEIMREFLELAKPYSRVNPICHAFRMRHEEHYATYANPVLACRNHVQGRLTEMTQDDRWPLKSRDRHYLKSIKYPVLDVLYYLSDVPEPDPPCGDGSDVA